MWGGSWSLVNVTVSSSLFLRAFSWLRHISCFWGYRWFFFCLLGYPAFQNGGLVLAMVIGFFVASVIGRC